MCCELKFFGKAGEQGTGQAGRLKTAYFAEDFVFPLKELGLYPVES